jgi:hypothetical protein
MIPVAELMTVAFSVMVMAARFGRLAKAMMLKMLGPNMIGSLRTGSKSARARQAVATSA